MRRSRYFQLILSFSLQWVGCNVAAAQCTFTSSVPYFESFTGIGSDNQLPNCWLSTNLGSGTLTFTNNPNAFTGQHCGAFNQSSGTNYFFSNGIFLHTGVTYSAGVYFKTDNTGGSNWNDLALLISGSQNTVGSTVIVSTASPNSPVYLGLGGTFTVGSSGLFYLLVRGGGVLGMAEKLYIDNLSIGIPCTGVGAVNAPTISISTNNGYTTVAGASSLCASAQNTLNALGAHTYTWAGGSNSSSITTNGSVLGMLAVSGTNTLTGCVGSASITSLHPVPNITLSTIAPTVCPGETVTLSAAGAHTYTWSNGGSSPSFTFVPLSTGAYTVTGTFTNTGCSKSVSVQVVVAPISVSVTASPVLICSGASTTLTAWGTSSYSWSGGAGTSSIIVISPTLNSSYTVTGFNSPVCRDSAVVNISVQPSPTLSVSGPSIICIGGQGEFLASGGTTYKWNGSGLVSAGGGATVNPTANSSYTVTTTGSNGCTATASVSLMVDECLGIEVNERHPLFAFPNPFNGILRIEGLNKDASVSMWTTTGITLRLYWRSPDTINTSEVPAGIYILRISSGEKNTVIRVIKL